MYYFKSYIFLAAILLGGCSDVSGKLDMSTDLSVSSSSTSQSSIRNDYKIYEDRDLGFSVEYPSNWIVEKYSWEKFGKDLYSVGFGPEISRPGGLYWGVEVHKKTNRYKPDLQKIIQKFSGPSDNINKFQKIEIDGWIVDFLVSKNPKYDLTGRSIYLETDDAIYVLYNGAVIYGDFERFYKSFKLL